VWDVSRWCVFLWNACRGLYQVATKISRFSKKRMVELTALYMERLGLAKHWHAQVDFARTIARGKNVGSTTWAGRDATIEYSEELKDASDRIRELTVIHEVRHLHYAPLWDKIYELFGGDSVVTNTLCALIEDLCDADAVMIYRFYHSRTRVSNGR